MKKLFEQPELAVEEFEIIDILTASGGGGGYVPGENEGDMDEFG